MYSKKKTTRTANAKRSPRYIVVSAVVTAIAIVISCVSTVTYGAPVSDTLYKGGSVLHAAAMEEQEIATNDWNIHPVDLEIVETFEVAFTVDGVIRTVVMENGTVADALNMAGIVVGEHDIVSLALDTQLTEKTSVAVDRVTFKERTETETVAYGKTSYETNDYNKGESVVVTEGKNGEKTLVYKDRFVNGEFVDSELQEETVTVKPVDQVTAIGTYVKPAPQPPQTNSGSAGATADFTYSAVYYGKATAYTNEGGICGEYTASGMKAQVGVVAVNPAVIPYGTRLYITTADGSYTYGYCVAGDTGGFIYSHPDTIVDLFMNTVAECYQFGRREVIVYVLD